MKIVTFWEPRNRMPDYIKLCMESWKIFLPEYEILVLDYSNIGEYLDINRYNIRLFDGTFSLSQIADAVRAMFLEEYGGIWMDADTIILDEHVKEFFVSDKDVSFFGIPEKKTVHIAWINAKPHARLMNEWVKYIIDKIENYVKPERNFWAYLGNSFVDTYICKNPNEVEILDVIEANTTPEKSLGGSNPEIYEKYYFRMNLHLKDIDTPMIMLHNSWTPKVFKEMLADEFLSYDCTLSNVLSDILGKNVVKNKVYGADKPDMVQNKFILHRIDGSLLNDPNILGLNVTFKGTGGVC